jgi:hypothetical protein
MMLRNLITAAAFALAALHASATPQRFNGTELWLNAMSDAEVTYRGFTAAMGTAPGAANLTGHIGGARTGNF